MSDPNSLANRIDAEFSAIEEKHKKAQLDQMKDYRERQKRYQQLNQVFDEMRGVWGPPLDVLAKKFGDKIQVTPRLLPSTREAVFEFQSKLARIRLKFSATTDRDVTKVILSSDLDVVPVLMQFDGHSEIEFPLTAVDKAAVARWVEDRIVSFVKNYLTLHDNDFYFKDEMVEDPIAGVSFPKFAAGAKLEWKGKTYYFVSEESRGEFAQQQGIGAK